MQLSDTKIKELVENNIKSDPILLDENIHVDVINGVVVLKGYVKTDLERSAAIDDSKVPGVSHVNAAYLKVD